MTITPERLAEIEARAASDTIDAYVLREWNIPALVAEVRRCWDAQQWRTMDSAPKDTAVLVYPSHVLGRSCDMAIYPDAHCVWMEVSEFGKTYLKPTHWKPLPAFGAIK